MATRENDSGRGEGPRRDEVAEVAARRSLLKAGATAGATGVGILSLGRKAWANTSAGASGANVATSQ